MEVLFTHDKGFIFQEYSLMNIHKLTAVDEGTTIIPHSHLLLLPVLPGVNAAFTEF